MQYNFKKYRYLGSVYPEVPKTWEPIIWDMLKQIDKDTRFRYVPRFLLNLMSNISHNFLEPFVPNTHITQIKQKFGLLKVYGIFPDKVKKHITLAETSCNNTCEFCGTTGTDTVMVKNWVRNICAICKENKQYGSNNRNNTSN